MPHEQAAKLAYNEALQEAAIAGDTDPLLIKLRKEYAAEQASLAIQLAPLFDNANASSVNTMEQIGAQLATNPSYDIGTTIPNFGQLSYTQQQNIKNRAHKLHVKNIQAIKKQEQDALKTLNTGVNTTSQGTDNGTNTRRIGDGIKSL